MAELRSLPHRMHAEAAVLGGVLLCGNDALDDIVDLIGADDFYVPKHQAVFEAMLMLVERGERIDVITLHAQLERCGQLQLVGDIEGLANLDRYATAHNLRVHAELIAEVARTRRLVVACREGAEKGMAADVDDGSYADGVTAAIEEAARTRSDTGPESAGNLVAGAFQAIVERQRQGASLTGVPTGFGKLDELTAGLQRTDLVIVAARPSMGKTAFALNMAASASVPKLPHLQLALDERPPLYPVLFFSLEMSKPQLMERLICAEARVDTARVRAGRSLLETEFRSIIHAAERIRHSELEIDDTAGISILELRARSRRWKRRTFGDEHGLGMVMLDYLQLASGGKARYESREQEVADITRGLKGLAKELRMPVVALSQLNRTVTHRADHRPQLSDLRESGSIEQDADTVMFVHREEMYLSAGAPEDERAAVANKAEIIVGKQRNGPLGVVPLHYLGPQTRFVEPTPER